MKYIPWIIIAFLAIWILKFQCKDKKSRDTSSDYSVSKITTKIDTIIIRDTSTIYKQKPPITQTIYQDIPACIDTQAILKDYYAKNIYLDTVFSDENSVVIKDTITQNKVQGRVVKFNLNNKIITRVDSIYLKPKDKLNIYLGGSYYTNKQFGVNSYFIYKNVGATIGVTTQPTINVGLIIKIK